MQIAFLDFDRFLVVGAKGFEPSTTRAQGECATSLRYAPISLSNYLVYELDDQDVQLAPGTEDNGIRQ